jgi:hypothetical protein
MMTELMWSSWETIARRTLLMAQNRCSPFEYQRMISEKTHAAMETGLKMLSSNGSAPMSALIAPWLKRTKANSRRLRRRK